MNETDEPIGKPIPRIEAVTARGQFSIAVTWTSGETQVIDLAPAIFRYRIYAPLRTDPDLFASIRVADEGFAVAWSDNAVDMASTTLEDLATQAMTSADFSAFIKREGYTLDGVAAELGISRRLAAYYQQGRTIPRYIALACAHLADRGSGGGRARPIPKR